jgi:hypothetical protein
VEGGIFGCRPSTLTNLHEGDIMPSWTNPSDVIGAWIGEGAPSDPQKIQNWIDKAEREIRFRVPDIQARVIAESILVPAVTDLLETVKDVVVAMVTRKFDNPRNVRQRNVTTGPYTSSETMGGDVPGDFTPTDGELAKLQAARSTGAYTVSMIPSSSPFSPDYQPRPYL